MIYFKDDSKNVENYGNDKDTKNIVIIKLKTFKNGVSWSELNNLVREAIGESKNYKIFNCPEGLLIEKEMVKSNTHGTSP